MFRFLKSEKSKLLSRRKSPPGIWVVVPHGLAELGGHDQLVPPLLLCQPTPNDLLRFAVLVAIGGVDEISARRHEAVQHL
jgi:hypothetical protein